MARRLTSEEFIKKSKEIHGDKYDYSLVDFKNVRSKIKLIYDNVIYEQFAYAHLQGKSPDKAPFKITNENFIKKSIELFGNIFDYSLVECDGMKSKVKLIYDDKVYEQVISDHLYGHLPRGIIKESKGITNIVNYLKNNNIEYIREYYYHDCKNINYLRFDFFLPKMNILIEYDGRQHFESVSIWGGDDALKITQNNDRIKNEYCKKNRIPLLRISYLEDVELILSNYLELYLKS